MLFPTNEPKEDDYTSIHIVDVEDDETGCFRYYFRTMSGLYSYLNTGEPILFTGYVDMIEPRLMN